MEIFIAHEEKICDKISASFGYQFSIEKWKKKQLGKTKIILKNMNPILGIVPIFLLSILGI